jgi:alpha-ribazole phosphatase
MKPPARSIDLLRHGETEGGQRFRGSRDDPLTERGWSQLRAATDLDTPLWDRVLCSPSIRCAAFADELSDRLGIDATRMDGLRERHFGLWEGRSAAELPQADLGAFWADPIGFTPPGAEDFADFRRRVQDAWLDVTTFAGRSLVVTHGGVIRVIVGEVLQMPPPALLLLEVPHACRTRIRLPIGDGLPSLVSHG